MTRLASAFAALVILCVAAGCSTMPPGSSFPKSQSDALDPATPTQLRRTYQDQVDAHPKTSGFHMISVGIDGLLARVELIDAAQRTLDLQYYIFRGDESGSVVARALLRAADRGVRIRILVDDGDTVKGDEKILSLTARPGIEVRIFNPLRYRGHSSALRGIELLAGKRRLDYRMHNKLLVADNAVALIGGRNIGDQYFQIDPNSQFGDDDVAVVGPAVTALSHVFDSFWHNRLAIPALAVDRKHTSPEALDSFSAALAASAARPVPALGEFAQRLAAGTPLSELKGTGQDGLSWSTSTLVFDSPDKKSVDEGDARGRLIYQGVADRSKTVTDELIMVSPYFVPSPDESALLTRERARKIHVCVLTNSLMAAPVLSAQAGYMRHRAALVAQGIGLHEIRALLGSGRGSGQSGYISHFGHYALHGKMYIFDRRSLFVGSMNFDERSKHLNTEIGLIIDSPVLAGAAARRFDELTQPDNAYSVQLSEEPAHLRWKTREGGTEVTYEREPARSRWQLLKVRLLALLPLDREL